MEVLLGKIVRKNVLSQLNDVILNFLANKPSFQKPL